MAPPRRLRVGDLRAHRQGAPRVRPWRQDGARGGTRRLHLRRAWRDPPRGQSKRGAVGDRRRARGRRRDRGQCRGSGVVADASSRRTRGRRSSVRERKSYSASRAGSRSRSPGTPAKSRALRVVSSKPCSSAVAAMSASGVSIFDDWRNRPARSAIARSTTSSRNGERRRRMSSSANRRPANSSVLVITEYEIPCPSILSRRVPPRTSMKTSVSTRSSATEAEPALSFPPLASGRDLETRQRPERLVEDPLRVGGRLAQIGGDGLAHDRGEALSLSLPPRLEPSPLLRAEVDLRTGSRHIQRSIQHAWVYGVLRAIRHQPAYVRDVSGQSAVVNAP